MIATENSNWAMPNDYEGDIGFSDDSALSVFIAGHDFVTEKRGYDREFAIRYVISFRCIYTA